MDKLLIGLHSSFAAIRTNLVLCTPKPLIKQITVALKEFEDNKTLRPSSAPIDSVIKDESTLYMNKEVKECVLNHHANIATEDIFSLTVAQLPAHDPLILALAEDHQVHTTIAGTCIFDASEDVPVEF
ncbi:hypothetical protein PILCRDRAFT_14978 [Piloderma croceum F 1598]|uniref:Uncharacterized protein n=1 Tax=Piloderma croceum (strain F 1598) TaxID=765440 RepID=A0A0C3EME6_PILCF|nr:hypothetical protein PILCRDRAFT_14978 [Piloderma croceum F 1598]